MEEPAAHEAGDALEAAARRLRDAARTHQPCAPVRDLLVGLGVADAYAVARRNVELDLAEGARVTGYKAGLTSLAVQRQLGVDQPDFGTLLDRCAYGDGEPVELGRLLQPRIEAEIAFVIGRDLPEHPVTAVAVLRATEFVLPALEIVDSRVANWDISLLDTVADNASSGLYTLGLTPRRLDGLDLRGAEMSLTRGGETVSVGSGAACLGHPVNAVVWLANTLAALATPLRSGDVVLSGALGPMVPVAEAGIFEADVRGVGSVRAEFVKREELR